MKNTSALLIMLVLSLPGCWVRWTLAVNDPLWIDELHTSWVVSDTLGQVEPRAVAGNQSPLFFWLVYPVVQWYGQTPLSLRAVSLLAGWGVIWLGAWNVWRLTRSGLALATTTLCLACDSQLIFYGSEARPYALVQLVGLGLTLQAWRRLNASAAGIDWGLFALALVVVLLHPTAVLLTCSVALLLYFGRRIPQPRDGLGIVFASLLGVVLNPATSTWFARRGLWSELTDLGSFLGLVLGLLGAAWCVPGLVRLWFHFTDRSRTGEQPQRTPEPALASQFAAIPALEPTAFWLGCFLLPAGVAAIVSWWNLAGLASARYLAVIWSFPAIGLGLLSAGLPWKRGLAVASLGTFLLAFGLVPIPGELGWTWIRTNPVMVSIVQQRALVGLRNEGWREIHARLTAAEATAPRRPIWLYPNLLEDELVEGGEGRSVALAEYLTFALRGIYQLPEGPLEPRAFRSPKLLQRSDLETLRASGVFVVVRCAERDLAGLVETWQADWKQLLGEESLGLQIELELSAGDVHLLRLKGASQSGGAEESE